MFFFLGCYTDAIHTNGLNTIDLDLATGRMAIVAEYPVSNAIYQALSPDGKYLYSCTRQGLASFRIGAKAAGGSSADSVELSQVDELALGCSTCHVAVMPDGKRTIWADYSGGTAGSVAVTEGRFGELVRHRHFGSGPNLPRQEKAHCHQAMPLPGGKGYCVVDLGLDAILSYPSGDKFDVAPAGSGPRHLVFHPNGHLVFLAHELGNVVSSLSWSENGGFKVLDTHSTIADQSLKETPWLAAAIRMTPRKDGVVVSNRGENSLAAYGFDEATGKMELKARTRLDGDWPRDFIFVSDTLALVACERSGDVLLMRYDPEKFTFAQVSKLGGFFRPVALLQIPGV